MSDPRVSIVVPAYNHERFVGETIESVLQQTFRDFELIVLDDGSTDRTPEIVRSFQDERLRFYPQSNAGLSVTLNKGLRLARGTLFGFLPSDDAFEREKLEVQVAEFDAHPGLGVVFALPAIVDVNGRPILDGPVVEWARVPYTTREEILPALFERNFLSAPSALVRRALVEQAGGFDEALRVLQDYDLWMRVLRLADARLLPTPLVRVRWHGGNQSAHATPETELERATVVFRACQTLDLREVFPSLVALDEATHPASFGRASLELATHLMESKLPAVWPWARIFLQRAIEQHPLLEIPPPLEPLLDQASELRRLARRPPSRGASAEKSRPAPRAATTRPPWARDGRLTVLHEVQHLDRGGLERIVFDLATGLGGHGIRSVVVCVEHGGYFADRCRTAGVPVEVLGRAREASYRAVLGHYAPEVVVSHHSFLGAEEAFRLGIPVVSVVQNVYAWQRDGILDQFRRVDPFFTRHVAVSTDAADYLAWRFNVARERIEVIRNAVSLEGFTEPPSRPVARSALGWSSDDYVFLLVGAICRVKSQRAAVAALAGVVREFPQARLLMLGHVAEPDYVEVLQRDIEGAGLRAHCTLVPFAEDPRPYYGLADAFVLPSLIEGFSLARLEAMAAGLPCITTRVGDAGWLFDQGGGLLIDNPYGSIARLDHDTLLSARLEDSPATVPALTEAMRTFLREPERWRIEGKTNPARVRALGLDTAEMVRRYATLLERECAAAAPTALPRARGQALALAQRLADVQSREEAQQTAIAQLASVVERATGQGTRDLDRRLDDIRQLVSVLLDRIDVTKRIQVRVERTAEVLRHRLPANVKKRLRPLYSRLIPERLRAPTTGEASSLETVMQRNDAEYRDERGRILELIRDAPTASPDLQAQLRELRQASRPKGIVIYPPTIGWTHSLFQRPHQLMRGFARKGYWAFFCSPRPVADKIAGLREVEPNLFVVESLQLLRFLDARDVVLWVSYPRHVVVREVFRQAWLIYDVIDELQVFTTYSHGMEEDHRALLKAADLVVVTAERLMDGVRTTRPDAILAPNGVWLEDFAPRAVPPAPPADLKEILARGAPIVGYHGALAKWFDYGLVNEVAEQCPELSFVLIGPDYDGSLKTLRARPNVWWLGPKPYRDVSRYVHRFDVAMIPFRVNTVTNSTSPIKLFEYMAAEKPTVTTDMVECRKYRSVLIASDATAFKACLGRALELRGDPEFLATARREAEENSWGQRIDTVLSAFARVSGAKP